MYSVHVHEAVLAAKEQETGITIHWVDEEYDHGAIVAQCHIPVVEADQVDTLAKRVLEREHSFLIETLARIISGKIVLSTSNGVPQPPQAQVK